MNFNFAVHAAVTQQCVYTQKQKAAEKKNLVNSLLNYLLKWNIIHLPSGHWSNTVCAISPAESDGLNKNSFVLPLTRIRRKFIWIARTMSEKKEER